MMNSKPQVSSTSEKFWRGAFFFLSAMVAARAMLDIEAGNLGAALGNIGVSCLMVSMIHRFPFMRAFVEAGAETNADPQKKRAELIQQAERLRAENPWASRVSRLGWIFFGASVFLRLTGVA